MKKIAYAGNDVHKETVSVAVYSEKGGDLLIEKTLSNQKGKITSFYKKLANEYEVKACYEASSCGYVFHRWLKEIGVSCEVIAPSLIPNKSGDRVKTDKRDAQKLGRYYRSGELTTIHIPNGREEAIRGLTRLREQVVKEIRASKQYMLKFLQVRGIVYRDGNNWTQKHWTFLKRVRMADELDQYTLERYMSLLEYKLLENKEIEQKIEEVSKEKEYGEQVKRLKSLRGIDTLTAMGIISEIIDFKRFGGAREFMSYVGLVPGEKSSGSKRYQGGITKCGNTRVRRLLVEAAWHYRHRPGISYALQSRLKGQSMEIKAASLRCQKRLHKRMHYLIMKNKAKNKAITAVARELAGFIWALMSDRIEGSKAKAA